MSFAIFLYLRLDWYKLLPWHWCPSITTPSTAVSLNSRHFLHGRDSLNYCVRGCRIIGTRHAPCPKYGAQMTTMMNTPRGIHFKTWTGTHRRSPLSNWRRDVGEDSIHEPIDRTVVRDFRANYVS